MNGRWGWLNRSNRLEVEIELEIELEIIELGEVQFKLGPFHRFHLQGIVVVVSLRRSTSTGVLEKAKMTRVAGSDSIKHNREAWAFTWY